MKLLFILSFVAGIQLFATSTYSQEMRLNINVEDVSIFELFKEIESISEFGFFYKSEEFDPDESYTVKMKRASIDEVLKEVLKSNEYSFRIVDKIIIVTRNPALISKLESQIRTVTGTVTDSYGSPIPGVSVLEKNTMNGSITDLQGKYSINLETENPVLVFSFVGMKTSEVIVGNRTVIDVTMEENLYDLEEVVVIGYGMMKKKDLTGSITSVKAKELEEVPTHSILNAIQGKAAGVDIVNSQRPGASSTIRIRGNRSLNASNNPLFVIDGIPVNSIEDFNVNDIESIDILKDASATAIYGARAANGVVLITTKKGQPGKSTISLDSYYGFHRKRNPVDMMNAAQYAEFKRTIAIQNSGYTSDVPDYDLDKGVFLGDEWEAIDQAWEDGVFYPERVRDYDWESQGLQNGYVTSHQLSASLGSEQFSGYMSANIYKNQSIIRGEDYDRWSLKSNLDYKVADFAKVGANLTFTRSTTNDISVFGQFQQTPPTVVPYDEDGELIFLLDGVGSTWVNPMYDFLENNRKNEEVNNRFLGSFYLDLNLPAGIKFISRFSPDYRDNREGDYYGRFTTEVRGAAGSTNYATLETGTIFRWTWDNILSIEQDINSANRIGLTLVKSMEKTIAEAFNGEAKDMPADYNLWYYFRGASIIQEVETGLMEQSFSSYAARLNYNLAERYLLTATARWDGASQLAEGSKWDFFPSTAFAWRISEEGFMASRPAWFNYLKFRAGWGITGNSAISSYQTDGTLGPASYSFDYGNTIALGTVLRTMQQKNLGWEKTTQYNTGLDASFLNNRVNLTMDLYLQNTTDLLMRRNLPIVFGFDNIWQNIGKTQNKGIELALSTINVMSENWSWTTDFTWYANREKIVELDTPDKTEIIGSGWFVGEPISAVYDYNVTGIWQANDPDLENFTQFRPGDIKVEDLYTLDENGEPIGQYFINEQDRLILGSRVPDWGGSFSSRLSYKNFELYTFAVARWGFLINSNYYSSSLNSTRNHWVVPYWTADNPSETFPSTTIQNEDIRDAFGIRDGSFIRLRTVSLSYNIPRKFIEGIWMENARVYITADNPLLYSKYEGVDPEMSTGSTPALRTFIFGLNVSF